MPREMRLFDLAPEEAPPPGSRTAPAPNHFALEPVAAGLGWVAADETGRLVEIHLDGLAMRAMNQRSVGAYLVAAINKVGEVAGRRLAEERRQSWSGTR